MSTGGGGMAAREAASARKESRALCGVIVVGSRIGSSGMIWAMTGSSGAAMGSSQGSWSCLRVSIDFARRIGNRSHVAMPGMNGQGGQRVEFETLVQSRRSVRGFRNGPVPRAVIEAIIDSAKRAPSSMNTQPWHVHVLTGSPLEQLRRRNMEEMVGGAKVKRDIISHGEYQGVHRTRQVDI